MATELSIDFLKAGKATFTVELSQEAARQAGKPHFTFQIVKQAKTGRYDVRLLTGPDNYKNFTRLGEFDAANGKLVRGFMAGYKIRESNAFDKAVAAVYRGRTGQDALHAEGYNLHPSSHCCRCCRRLTVPASIECGVGPECESYVKLGIVKIDEVPCTKDLQVAKLQYGYWMNSDKLCLIALEDACLEAGFPIEQAKAMVDVTRSTMRKFKKGKALPKAFLAFVGA